MQIQKDRFFQICLHAFLLTALVIIFIFIICRSVFLGRVIQRDLSYNCNDDITNEVSKKESENTKKFYLLTAINLGLNVFTFLINILIMLIICILDKLGCFNSSKNRNNIRPTVKEKDFKPG